MKKKIMAITAAAIMALSSSHLQDAAAVKKLLPMPIWLTFRIRALLL